MACMASAIYFIINAMPILASESAKTVATVTPKFFLLFFISWSLHSSRKVLTFLVFFILSFLPFHKVLLILGYTVKWFDTFAFFVYKYRQTRPAPP